MQAMLRSCAPVKPTGQLGSSSIRRAPVMHMRFNVRSGANSEDHSDSVNSAQPTRKPPVLTYSAQIVYKEAVKMGLDVWPHSPATGNFTFYEHGLVAKISPDIGISMQTHPAIAGSAFAETAILRMITTEYGEAGKTIQPPELGYEDYNVMKHDNPEALTTHLKAVLQHVQAGGKVSDAADKHK